VLALAGTWHTKIVQILDELCQEDVKNGIYSKVYKNKAIEPTLSYMKQVVWYQPDLYAVRKKDEKIDVFEVIDTETEGEAIGDIVLSALIPHIADFCIVCSDYKYLEKIKTNAKVILNKIYDEDKKPYSSIFNPNYFVHIPRNTRFTQKTIATIKKQLKQQLEFGTL
jgi:hypothetical protein